MIPAVTALELNLILTGLATYSPQIRRDEYACSLWS
jgi:hypothetical protein